MYSLYTKKIQFFLSSKYFYWNQNLFNSNKSFNEIFLILMFSLSMSFYKRRCLCFGNVLVYCLTQVLNAPLNGMVASIFVSFNPHSKSLMTPSFTIWIGWSACEFTLIETKVFRMVTKVLKLYNLSVLILILSYEKMLKNNGIRKMILFKTFRWALKTTV